MSENVNNCPCMEKCPLESAMDLIGGKWKLQILCSLYADGPTRYNMLKKKMLGISNTMLASALKDLEKDGLIIREQFPEIPVRVEYRTTDACVSLMPILAELSNWGYRLKTGKHIDSKI